MIKATRRLTNFNFREDGAHVALVGKHQGGPANGITTLITKATAHIDQAVIEKASTVTVTMQFPEFLRKFFGMYWDDSEVLSAAMGYGRTEYPDETVKDWIDQRVESISIMKSVYRAQDVEKALADLTPEQTLALLKDQEMLEKALDNLPEQSQLNEEETPLETILKSAHEEFVTKAVSDAVAPVQKALDEQAVVLKAAQDQVAAFVAAEQAAVTKARTEALAAVVPADKVEALMKAYAPMDAEGFQVAVEALAVVKALADQSDLLTETGVSGAGADDQQEVDRTFEILKARHAPKAK